MYARTSIQTKDTRNAIRIEIFSAMANRSIEVNDNLYKSKHCNAVTWPDCSVFYGTVRYPVTWAYVGMTSFTRPNSATGLRTSEITFIEYYICDPICDNLSTTNNLLIIYKYPQIASSEIIIYFLAYILITQCKCTLLLFFIDAFIPRCVFLF